MRPADYVKLYEHTRALFIYNREKKTLLIYVT